MCARDGCDGVAGWNIEMWQLAAHLRFERRNRDGLRDGMLLRTQSGHQTGSKSRSTVVSSRAEELCWRAG
jgi:hypothetical protein